MEWFEKLSILKKAALIVLALIGIFDTSALVGLIITGVVVYVLIQLFMSFGGQNHPATSTDDDDDYAADEEAERLNQENIANQEALDRLL